jgi:hypothetical protein
VPGVSGFESRFLMVAAQRTLSGKNAKPPIVSSQEVYVGGRRGRRDGRGGLTTPWHGQDWAVPPGGVSPSWPLSVSSSGSVGLLVK